MTENNRPYLRIATEEAWAPKEMMDLYRKIYQDRTLDDPGFDSLWGFYAFSEAERPKFIFEHLQDLGEKRIGHMDESGIDIQVIALTSPGVQIFDKDTANAIATSSNDELAEACRKYPDRFVGMAAVAPQDPAAASREMERAVKTLDLRAVIINDHTFGEYLSDQKFWPILEAAEALDVPIYLHPFTPPKNMIGPMLESGLDGAIYGFGVETGLHMLKIICSGAFDRFPKLRFIIGHMGEALPFWLYRLDYMHNATVRAKRYESMKPLQKKISDYLRENVYITNSGVAWQPAIEFTQKIIGVDRTLYAMDYPYQYTPEEVVMLDAMTIPDEDKKKFFQTNAERVFRINQ